MFLLKNLPLTFFLQAIFCSIYWTRIRFSHKIKDGFSESVFPLLTCSNYWKLIVVFRFLSHIRGQTVVSHFIYIIQQLLQVIFTGKWRLNDNLRNWLLQNTDPEPFTQSPHALYSHRSVSTRTAPNKRSRTYSRSVSGPLFLKPY